MTLSSSGSRICLYDSREQAECAMKRAAAFGHEDTFNVRFDTVDAFLSELWDLWGDGRRIIDRLERIVIIRKMLEDQDVFAKTIGVAKALGEIIGECSGSPELISALANSRGAHDAFNKGDRLVLEFISRYRSILDNLCFIEAGDAASFMMRIIPPMRVELFSRRRLYLAIDIFLKNCAGGHFEYKEPEMLPLDTQKEAAFLRPAGPAALTRVVYGEIALQVAAHSGEPWSILVCCDDPLALFDELRGELVEMGATARVSTHIPFLETGLGRACGIAGRIVMHEAVSSDMVDFAYSDWSDISSFEAENLDAEMRGDRSTSIEEVTERLKRSSSTLPHLIDLFGNSDSRRCSLEALEKYMRSETRLLGMDGSIEHRAFDALQKMCDAYDAFECSHECAFMNPDILSTPTVTYTFAVKGKDDRQSNFVVEFREMNTLASLVTDSFDEVLLCDVSDAAFGSDLMGAASNKFLEKLYALDGDHSLSDARLAFASAMHAARCRFVCVMPERDNDHNETYPSFVFEEYLTTLMNIPVGMGDIDEAMMSLDPSAEVIGEDDIVSCVGKGLSPARDIETLITTERGNLKYLDMMDFLKVVPHEDKCIPVLSPSSIEKYAHCPYRWFIEDRLGPQHLDEGFGPQEMGIFVHEVMAEYYTSCNVLSSHEERLSTEVYPKMLDKAFDDVLERQKGKSGIRFLPMTAVEHLETELLRRRLHTFLDILEGLPKDYSVHGHEIRIDPDMSIDYAGVRLSGRADRVDVRNDRREFAVLDYKGSIDGHSAGDACGEQGNISELPTKIQALIYAQAFQRLWETYSCVAAVYLSYRAAHQRNSIAGSVDLSRYPIGNLATKSSEVVEMSKFIDRIEDMVTPRMNALMDGDISVCDASSRGCEYCLFAFCERSA